jgi:hypothetical protein
MLAPCINKQRRFSKLSEFAKLENITRFFERTSTVLFGNKVLLQNEKAMQFTTLKLLVLRTVLAVKTIVANGKEIYTSRETNL